MKDEVTTWMENAARFPVLSPERITLIARKIQSLPENSPKRKKLVNTLVNHNLRLVVKFVSSFMGGSCHNRWGSPETVDYLQVGAMGLIRAAELYDPSRGYTFSTYANHWIRSKVARYNLKTKTIVHVSESMARKLIFFNRNGYLRSKSTNRLIDNKIVAPMLREVENALCCHSLNAVDRYGNEFINSIVDKSSEQEERDVFNEIHEALDDAGVSALGKEILFSIFVHENTCPEIADRLNTSVHKIRREKDLAMRLAKRSKALERLV